MPDTPDALAIYREAAFPGARIGVAKKDAAPGIDAPTRLLSYDSYIVANKDVPDAVITKLLEGLWKGTDDLIKVHPSMRGYTHESAVTDAPVIPYHPAAIAFYKKEGLWDAEAQKRQDALMTQVGK